MSVIIKDFSKRKERINSPMAFNASRWKRDYYAKEYRQMLRYEALNQTVPTIIRQLSEEELEEIRKQEEKNKKPSYWKLSSNTVTKNK